MYRLFDGTLLFCAVEVYKTYNTLDISGLHKYQLCLLVHKFLFCNNMLPLVFKIILHKILQFTSIAQNNVMIYIYNDVTFQSLGIRLITFKATQLWNQLPNE